MSLRVHNGMIFNVQVKVIPRIQDSEADLGGELIV